MALGHRAVADENDTLKIAALCRYFAHCYYFFLESSVSLSGNVPVKSLRLKPHPSDIMQPAQVLLLAARRRWSHKE